MFHIFKVDGRKIDTIHMFSNKKKSKKIMYQYHEAFSFFFFFFLLHTFRIKFYIYIYFLHIVHYLCAQSRTPLHLIEK